MLSPALAEALRQALAGLPARPPRMAVAVSGGADSAMLALHAAAIAREQGIDLLLFHVHHGLQDAADAWSEQTRALARLLGLPAHEARVTVAEGAGKGIEAAARDARYRALAGLAREHGAPLVLLAHHRGDQAETVLLRLLRGTGLAGMAAMAPLSRRDEVDYLRPWLDQDRDDILRACAAFEAATGWRAVQDPTNSDPHYTRAALRELLAPALDARWPGWRGIVARHARHMAEAASILDEVAREDFAALEPGPDGASFRCARGAICRRRGRRRCCAGGWTPMARACLRKRACATCCASCAACTAWVMTASCASSRPAMRSAATVAGSGWSVAESRSGLAGTPLSPGRAGRCCG